MKKNIQILNWRTGSVIFEFEKENNTLKDTVIEAVNNGVDLSGADLRDADLRFAVLRDANLRDANLSGANITGANLSGANLSDANLRGANLVGARFDSVNLHNVDLRDANLSIANLSGANLSDANLSGANITGVNLCYADLSGADLRGANIRYTNLRDADLRDADLRDADLACARFAGANLRDADLRGADLYNADLRYAKNIPDLPLACPSEGAFIGWKKVRSRLVKLEIPEDAKRSSATTNKCRCDKALVLSITDLEGKNPIPEIKNTAQLHHIVYKVGEIVYPDSFDEDRWNECSHGIHFFVNKQDAIDYQHTQT